MKRHHEWFMLGSLTILVTCAQPPRDLAPVEQGGWLTYSESRIRTPIACGPVPIQLAGSRLDTRLTGGCRYVRITGGHNDIQIDIAPGGTIELVGSNNDVVWKQIQPGPTPRLIDTGANNTFHQG
jgi:Protein of unknown function (DUF3060)